MRLIDADALPKYTGYALSADEVAKAVEVAPTIDAVPVVRCKDCKWWGDIDPRNRYTDCYCHVVECSTEPDWFCADGERKDDGMDC